ncbi:plasmid pRiA4b ORF-3 family protein [Xenorhabdus bovienii]|uniref:plasmid pRiA4b ORF-3 family protein n=1 Tax=Xenorhabdus bovienii TaxID=40576 RepID=UPI00237D1B72|nr:plasmid pRiA4b ORF-3 family protein [Xenorhabdus bovienii]MDE1488803.1 plasmid pRiA4b ORF-3 family protein [Xenorhabdus bovienii]MDE1497280.1 plasmid pRiA4b ORF-3 family protein [Xenorhabdus bovienii]MDE9438009.1 plasmid pRiA4b ORF-3 family protein [Xenorhabdus bovienii]MDE9466851.1 plasmid pRiA4b ORF-3 family protein [Xenorhabdus bovienii]MDE9475213.1 plasmid pRiA4b ORF-3 family protein [Xenorhabdus bovienii]
MQTYIVKVALRDISPMVWRRFRLSGKTSLAAFHYIIQIAQGWHDDHLHQFRIYGKDYGISYSGGIAFPDNPYKVTLDDLEFDAGDRFTYEYNFFENWLHDIRIETILDNSNLKSPFCLAGNRMPRATLADECDKTLALLEAIVNADEAATVGDIRSLIDELDAVRFNRKKVNRQLRQLNLGSPELEPAVIAL